VIYFVFLGEGGSMVWYGMVSLYHVNTQYRIESLPLPGIAHLY